MVSKSRKRRVKKNTWETYPKQAVSFTFWPIVGWGTFWLSFFLKKSYENRLIYMTFERVCEKFPLPGRKNELSHTRSKMLRNSTRELVCEKKPSVLSRKTHSTLAFSHTRSERLSLFEDRF